MQQNLVAVTCALDSIVHIRLLAVLLVAQQQEQQQRRRGILEKKHYQIPSCYAVEQHHMQQILVVALACATDAIVHMRLLVVLHE